MTNNNDLARASEDILIFDPAESEDILIFDPAEFDLGRMSEEQRELAAGHVLMAKSWARRYAKRRPHLADDFESDALYALCLAAKSWDDRGLPFPTYARIIIQSKLQETIRNDRPKGYRRTQAEAVVPRLIGFDPASHSPSWSADSRPGEEAEVISLSLRAIGPALADVLRLRHLEGKSVSETAEILELPKRSMYWTERRAKDEFRDHYGRTG